MSADVIDVAGILWPCCMNVVICVGDELHDRAAKVR
jgi:hypothetical protein